MQSESEGLRTRRTDAVGSNLKACRLRTQGQSTFQVKSDGRKNLMSQLKGSQADQPFSFFRLLTDGARPTHIREGIPLCSAYRFKC